MDVRYNSVSRVVKELTGMENQILSDKTACKSNDFFCVSDITRYVNDKNDGRHVTFNVTEAGDYHVYFVANGTLEIKN